MLKYVLKNWENNSQCKNKPKNAVAVFTDILHNNDLWHFFPAHRSPLALLPDEAPQVAEGQT